MSSAAVVIGALRVKLSLRIFIVSSIRIYGIRKKLFSHSILNQDLNMFYFPTGFIITLDNRQTKV